MEGKDYLKHFDKIFNTQTLKNINLDNMVLLKELYSLLEEYLSKSNIESSTIRRKSIKLYDRENKFRGFSEPGKSRQLSILNSFAYCKTISYF